MMNGDINDIGYRMFGERRMDKQKLACSESTTTAVCVCVCERERERERESVLYFCFCEFMRDEIGDAIL